MNGTAFPHMLCPCGAWAVHPSHDDEGGLPCADPFAMLEGLDAPPPQAPNTALASGGAQPSRGLLDLDALYSAPPQAVTAGALQQHDPAALLSSGPGPQEPVFGSMAQALPTMSPPTNLVQTMDLMGELAHRAPVMMPSALQALY